ncbi:CDP-alcohol phosphatidyltransferase family protein [soil metagenome]
MPSSPAAKPRPRSEVVMRVVQPVATLGVRGLARLGVNPLFVVLTHALLGFAAAALLALGFGYGTFVIAALLLQAKTLLDNMDGGLARATGQVTLMGRYFDTGMDFFVNVALFAALTLYGSPAFALLAFVLLTLLLSFDYHAERGYKLERQGLPHDDDVPIGAPRPLYLFFKRLYEVVFAPQDRLLTWLERRRFKHLSGVTYRRAPVELRLAWHDLFSTAALVNLGLSTQLLVFGLCLLVGQPFWYVYSLFFETLYVLCVQLLRDARFRRYVQGVEQHV